MLTFWPGKKHVCHGRWRSIFRFEQASSREYWPRSILRSPASWKRTLGTATKASADVMNSRWTGDRRLKASRKRTGCWRSTCCGKFACIFKTMSNTWTLAFKIFNMMSLRSSFCSWVAALFMTLVNDRMRSVCEFRIYLLAFIPLLTTAIFSCWLSNVSRCCCSSLWHWSFRFACTRLAYVLWSIAIELLNVLLLAYPHNRSDHVQKTSAFN